MRGERRETGEAREETVILLIIKKRAGKGIMEMLGLAFTMAGHRHGQLFLSH